jgi:apolipoprotein N-acyltransferase
MPSHPAFGALAAAFAFTAAGLPDGAWWLALLGSALLWSTLARTPPLRALVFAALALAPIPAIGYHGLIRSDPWLYPLVIALASIAYATVGAAAAAGVEALARRSAQAHAAAPLPPLTPSTPLPSTPLPSTPLPSTPVPPAVRPLPWLSAWFALDALAAHGAFGAATLPVTPGYLLAGGPLIAFAAWAGPAGLGAALSICGIALASLLPLPWRIPGAARWRIAALALPLVAVAWHASPPLPSRGRVVAVTQPAAAQAPVAAQAPAAAQVPVAAQTSAATQAPAAAQVPVAAQTSAATQAPAAAQTSAPIDPLAALTAAAAQLGDADLHVWPELALGRTLARDLTPLRRAARQLATPILTGALRYDPAGGERNAAAFADAVGGGFPAEKRRLVPRYEDWAEPGVGERWPLRTAGWQWGVLICWESLLYGEALDRVARGADALIVLADGTWATGTVTPWWHARAARVLAVATGRSVVFASSAGPSWVWAADGRATGFVAADASGGRLPVAAPPPVATPFARFGLVGLLITWGLASSAIVVAALRPPPPHPFGCGTSTPAAA